MATDTSPAKPLLRGTVSLVIAIGVVASVLIFFPAYRLFFAISLVIGCVVAGVLYFRNKYVPLKEEEIHNNKRPLGLD